MMRRIVLSLLFLTSPILLAGTVYYKYKDANGNTVMNDSIPSDAMDQGYTILNARGQVIEVVPSKSQKKEHAAEEASLEKAAARTAAANREQAQRDNVLMKTFESVDDITQFEKNQVDAIDTTLTFTRGQVERLQTKLETLEQQSKQYSDAGTPIPENLQNSITEVRSALNENREYIKQKEEERQNVQEEHQKMRQRFMELKHEQSEENAYAP